MNSDDDCIVQPKHVDFYITVIKCCEWTFHFIVYVLASLIRRLSDTRDNLEILKKNVWLASARNQTSVPHFSFVVQSASKEE
jgi:hypothetical protein